MSAGSRFALYLEHGQSIQQGFHAPAAQRFIAGKSNFPCCQSGGGSKHPQTGTGVAHIQNFIRYSKVAAAAGYLPAVGKFFCLGPQFDGGGKGAGGIKAQKG